jgi:hypothetical protein
MRWNRTAALVVVVDFLLAVLLMQQAVLSLTTVQKKIVTQSISTDGVYAVTSNWSTKSDDDVDLYMQDPTGNIVYFANKDAGLMHLERDDLGIIADTVGGVTYGGNNERIVIRGFQPGEYTVNVHMYNYASTGETIVVTIKLWKLRGADMLVRTEQVSLSAQGQEETVFRFTLSRSGEITSMNTLPKRFVESAPGASSATSPGNP